jgi:hypothetical protein
MQTRKSAIPSTPRRRQEESKTLRRSFSQKVQDDDCRESVQLAWSLHIQELRDLVKGSKH